jgi:hypothetical protein
MKSVQSSNVSEVSNRDPETNAIHVRFKSGGAGQAKVDRNVAMGIRLFLGQLS